jgi:hypothetical protein
MAMRTIPFINLTPDRRWTCRACGNYHHEPPLVEVDPDQPMWFDHVTCRRCSQEYDVAPLGGQDDSPLPLPVKQNQYVVRLKETLWAKIKEGRDHRAISDLVTLAICRQLDLYPSDYGLTVPAEANPDAAPPG